MDGEDLRAYRAMLPPHVPADITVVEIREPTPVDLQLCLSDGSIGVFWRLPPSGSDVDGWRWAYRSGAS